ncbi:MAG: LapA family protein [Alphaproteobacteria bacterium]|nr:LapA family protein [Alphaproteobacteria bacterium]
MSFFRFLIGIALIVAVAVLAVMNNDMVSINMWPFYIDIKAAMSIVIIALVLLGFIFGKIDSWIAYSPLRSALRLQKRQNKKLNVEQQKLVEKVEGLKENLESMKSAEAPLMTSPKPNLSEKIKQKMSGLFKKKSKKDDFWSL